MMCVDIYRISEEKNCTVGLTENALETDELEILNTVPVFYFLTNVE